MVGRHSLRTVLLLVSALISSCGGGGGGGSGSPQLAAPSNLKYPAPPAFVIQQAIAALTPTVTGQVASYGVSPALPAGLTIDSTTGVISGSPTAVSPATNYTVTATNAGGSTTASVSLVVNDIPPTIAYQSPYYAFTANIATQQTIKPTASGGAVVSWSVNPALPAGLAFSATDGSISGTPTAAAASAPYVATATNSGGKSTVSLTIAVAGAPLLDLGHADAVIFIRTTGSRVLSMDSAGHWVLQDFASGTTLASGESAYAANASSFGYSQGRFTHLPMDLAGNTVIVAVTGGVEARASADGHLLATIPGQYTWSQLAADGSYITTGNATALAAWTPSGQSLLSRPGDYSQALTFSAPGAVQVALGAAGQSVIETVSVSTTTSTVSPSFQGTFNSWFVDGARFLTHQGNAVWTYSSAAVQQDITQLSQLSGFGSLIGQGNWLWTYDLSTLNVYQVGSSVSPAFTWQGGNSLAVALPSGSTIGILTYGDPVATVIDLSGTAPVRATYSVPVADLSAYAAVSSTAWLVGNSNGVVLDGASVASQPRYLTLGAAWSIAGGTGFVSVATASGKVFTFDASTDALVSTIKFSSSHLSASTSGTTLAALANTNDFQYEADRTLNIYSLPSGTTAGSFPGSLNSPQYLTNISLSGSGTVLAESYSSGSGCNNEVLPVTGGAPIWCDTSRLFYDVQLSPDGTLIAASTILTPAASTNIYKNGTLVTAVPGWAVGWLDNARLLAITYINREPASKYDKSIIYDSLGNVLGTPPLPEMHAIQAATPDTLYSPSVNEIVSLTTGAVTWASGNSAKGFVTGAISGSQVIFPSGSLVLAQPY